MSVPRITLWTNPFRMPLRMAVCPFDLRDYVPQVTQIQEKTHRFIEITPGALYILSCIAGRRMPEPVRWVLFDSLQAILNGELQNRFPERQDLLASTFGELLGVALLAIRLGRSVEIFRLLESGRGKMPDFLLLQDTPVGSYAHVLECKGRVEDVRNINNLAGVFDLCKEQRDFRTKARKQIDEIGRSPIKLGPRTVIRQRIPFGFSHLASTQNIVVSSFPDGRITQDCTHSMFATRTPCQPPSRVTCVKCMTNTRNTSQTNVISVLYQKVVASNSAIDQALVSFLKDYRTAQQAVWSENNTLFATTLNNMVEQLTSHHLQEAVIPSSIFMLITLLEVAISEGITGFDIDTHSIEALASEEQRTIWNEVYRELLDIRQRGGRQSRPATLPYPQGSTDWQDWRTQQDLMQDFIPEEQRRERWYATDPVVTQTVDTIFRETNAPFRATIVGNDVYGSLQNEEHVAIIRLVSTNRATLEKYVNGLIAQLRKGREVPKDDWHEEFLQEGDYDKEAMGSSFLVGKSWDKFPYPHPSIDLPGITAWLAEDGRAEIFIRKLGYMNNI